MSKLAPTFREALTQYLETSGGVLLERFDGTIAPVSLDEPGSITRNITDADIAVDSNNVAMWNYGFISPKLLITRIDLNYKSILPLKDGFVSKVFAQRVGAIGDDHNIASLDEDGNSGSFYTALLQSAYDVTQEEQPLTLHIEGIRDQTTAENLARLIIKWRTRLLAQISFHCTYKVLDIELWDKIGVTATVVSSFLLTKTWLVTGHRITPFINGKVGEVKLDLLEMGTAAASIPVNQWIDNITNANKKVDNITDTNKVVEVI